jgi:hypothetical protein
MKTTLAIITGYVAWTVLWLGGNAVLAAIGLLPREREVRLDAAGSLCALLALSAVASVTAGYLCRVIARVRVAPVILAVLLLATGLAVQWSVRSLMPLWYHVVFLALIVPLCLAGSRMSRAVLAGR